MKGDEQTEPGHPAPVEIDCDHARLVGEIIADAIAQLGERRAMMPDGYVQIGPVRERGGGTLTGPSTRGARGDHAEGPTMMDGGSGISRPSLGRQMWRQ